jgi:hypothetical protein
MPYELLSRALAYTSCLSTMSMFLTAMALVVTNVGTVKPPALCAPAGCTALVKPGGPPGHGSLISPAHAETIASGVPTKKI